MASQRTRLWINIALLLAVGVLVMLVVLRPDSDAGSDDRITSLEPDAIERIRVEGEDRPPVTLERRGEHWWLTEPWEIEASRPRAEDLSALATTRSFSRYDAAGLDLARYGLAPARMRLWLNDTLIELGDTNPVNRQRYARIGDRVHLIDDTHTFILTSTLASYLGPRLLPREPGITRIELPALDATRTETGGWQSDTGLDSDGLQALVSAWHSAEALWSKDYEAPADKEFPRVRITLDDGETVEFAILSTTPDLVLARPGLGVAYTLPGEQREVLLPGGVRN